jgi:hypothetical protein
LGIPWPKSYLVALALVGCGSKPATDPPPHRDDAAVRLGDAGYHVAAAPGHPLGLPDFEAWEWRKRAGMPAFRAARKAEARADWAAVATSCGEALAADPGHLEAAWLLAVANGKLDKLDAVTAPLALAGAGDFGKWALASLDQPGLQPYLATPAGQAWRQRVELDRAKYFDAVAHGLVVIAKGDVFAIYDQRWYRLTRTYGGVVGAYVNGRRLAYITRGKTSHKLAVGSVDLDTGITTRPQAIAPAATQIAYVAKPEPGFWIGQPQQKPRLLAIAGGNQQGLLAPTKLAARPSGPWLEVDTGGGVRLHRTPVANITADWDDQGLASAIRIAASNRVVTVPGQIAGDTVVWSPDRNHLAFVAQLSDHCESSKAGVAAYVIDAATGGASELVRAQHGLSIDWLDDRNIAIASDDGVTTRGLAGSPQQLAGATNLVRPRFSPRCESMVPVTDDGTAEPAEPDAE